MAFSRLLQVIGNSRRFSYGKMVHAKMVASGLLSDVYAHNNLLLMYVKCQRMEDARKLFDTMPDKNVVSWTMLTSGYLKVGRAEVALDCFQWMVRDGCFPNEFTFVNALSACTVIGDLRAGKEIHGMVYRVGQGYVENFVSNSLVNFYAKCGLVNMAKRVFNAIVCPNVVSWTSIISGYCHCSQNVEALHAFLLARSRGVLVNEFLLATVLSACSGLEGVPHSLIGKQVHCLVTKIGFLSDRYVESGLVDLYVKFGSLFSAHCVFDESAEPSVVSWTMLIGGYIQDGQPKKAINLFIKMFFKGLEPNAHTLSTTIAACSDAIEIRGGLQIHCITLKYGLSFTVGNALINLYAKCGIMEDSTKAFEEMRDRDVVSWNTLIAGYVAQGNAEEVVELLKSMSTEGIRPDHYTYSSILSLCGDLPALNWGMQSHSVVVKSCFDDSVIVGSALLDMYAKCGRLSVACRIFDNITVKNVVSWNSMIVGYAQHGFGKEALDMFCCMRHGNVTPNDITFVGVLSACAHMGLIDEGRNHFDSMVMHHGIVPTIDHFACMIDLFARAGQISKAYELIKSMPMEANQVIWRSLLSGCRTYGDLDTGVYAAQMILKIDPQDFSAKIMWCHVSAKSDIWNEKAKVRLAITGQKKDAGCSWIEIKNKVHSFTVSDKATEDIYKIVKDLAFQMMEIGYVPKAQLGHETGEKYVACDNIFPHL